jgi:DNA-binding NarL/FixJ family response regulator
METREDSIKVFIADRQPLLRRGIQDTLNAMPDIEICGEGDVNNKVLEMLETLDPDVVLMDTDSPSLSGIRLCQDIKHRFPAHGEHPIN